MATSALQQTDVFDMLLVDHGMIRGLLDGFAHQGSAEQRGDQFRTITAMLVQHEVAEEEAVYPVMRASGGVNADGMYARIREEGEIKQLLRGMERLDVMGTEFDYRFRQLEGVVLDHSRMEEQVVFPMLAAAIAADERLLMGQRYERVKLRSPARPHPDAPGEPAFSRAMSSITALGDRIREAHRGSPNRSDS